MMPNDYQILAARTMNRKLYPDDQTSHALHGMVAEIGEIHSIFQKAYQGHEIRSKNIREELGDLLWFIAEYCTSMNWNLEDIMVENIEKLKRRYPNGFDSERSVHREEY